MTVAIYVRVSTEDQVDRNIIDIQLGALRLLVDDEVGYLDDAISGKVPLGQRPAGARLPADVRAKKFSEVVVCKLDRLGRSLRGVLGAHDALHDLGVTFRDTHIGLALPLRAP